MWIVAMLSQLFLAMLGTVLQGLALGVGFAVGKSLMEKK